MTYLPSVQILSELFRFLSFNTHSNLNVQIFKISIKSKHKSSSMIQKSSYEQIDF